MENYIERYEGLMARQSVDKVSAKLQRQLLANLQKIEALKSELLVIEQFIAIAEEATQQDLAPLHRKYNTRLGNFLLTLETHLDSDFFTIEELTKLKLYLGSIALQLTQAGLVHLQPLVDKYFPDENPSHEVDNYESQPLEEPVAALPKATVTPPKSLRALYMELVKEFHPDLEQDEAEKIRKTQLMHQITEAYAQQDVFELMRLRLTWLNEKQLQEQSMEGQLKKLVKDLNQQINTLQTRKENLYQHPYWAYGKGNLKTLDITITTEVNRLRKEIKTLEYHRQVVQLKENVRQFLATI